MGRVAEAVGQSRLFRRTHARWLVIAVLCLLAVALALRVDWEQWVMGWAATTFKAMWGGAIGWAISRYVLRLDLSEVEVTDRAVAGMAQAILVAGFALAIATGA